MKSNLTLTIMLLCAILVLTGCNAAPDNQPAPGTATIPVESPTEPESASPNPFLSVTCDKPPVSGLPFIPSGGQYEGWQRYSNENYGFSLALPAEWVLIEGENFACLKPESESPLTLLVAFKKDTENISIQRSGLPAGDVVTRGQLLFLGSEIDKNVLVYDGKDKAVLYHWAGEIRIGEMAFTISLDDTVQQDYDSVEIPADVQAVADQIVSSFTMP